MALPEWELWACALAIERQHGAAAPAQIAARIEALTLAGDAAGVACWRAIAAKHAALTAARAPD